MIPRRFMVTAVCSLIIIGALSVIGMMSLMIRPSNVDKIKAGMTSAQVEAIMGRPARIEQSETADQTLNGEVDHYPASNGEGRVIFVNHTVFKAEFIPGLKS